MKKNWLFRVVGLAVVSTVAGLTLLLLSAAAGCLFGLWSEALIKAFAGWLLLSVIVFLWSIVYLLIRESWNE